MGAKGRGATGGILELDLTDDSTSKDGVRCFCCLSSDGKDEEDSEGIVKMVVSLANAGKPVPIAVWGLGGGAGGLQGAGGGEGAAEDEGETMVDAGADDVGGGRGEALGLTAMTGLLLPAELVPSWIGICIKVTSGTRGSEPSAKVFAAVEMLLSDCVLETIDGLEITCRTSSSAPHFSLISEAILTVTGALGFGVGRGRPAE